MKRDNLTLSFMTKHITIKQHSCIIMKRYTIGRSSSNDIIIKDSTVSTNHAIIETIDEKSDFFRLTDLESTNGTFVNGKKITKAIISPKDNLRFGQYTTNCDTLILQAKKPHPIISSQTTTGYIKSIGREKAPMNDITLPYPDVSKKHAILEKKKNGEIEITDNNSTNGTFVNGLKIKKAILKPGDTVLIANKYPINWEHLFKSNRKTKSFLYVSMSAAILIFLIGLFVWSPWKPWDSSKIYSTYRKSVVLILNEFTYKVTFDGLPFSYYSGNTAIDNVYLNEGKLCSGFAASTGSGSFISDDGKILTNRHVVSLMPEEENTAELIKELCIGWMLANYSKQDIITLISNTKMEVKYVTTYLGVALNDTYVKTDNDFIPCSIYKISDNDKVDAAIIQTNNKTTPAEVINIVNIEKGAEGEELGLGKKVYSIGFPTGFILGTTEIGLEANNQSGEITQELGEYQYGHNITTTHGASGSPIFNDRGKFAGIIVSGYAGSEKEFNQAVRPERILEMIN